MPVCTKTCTKCKKKKPLNEFSWKVESKNRRQAWCKECQNTYNRTHYSTNVKYYKKKAQKRNKATRVENREKLRAYLRSRHCVDCGEKNITVLSFDHTTGTKTANVSDLVHNCCSWTTIMKEIRKCKIRCMNCHTKMTAKRAGWNKI